MNAPALRQIAERACEFLPSWKDNIILAVIGAAAMWFYGMPLWAVLAGYVLGVPLVCGLLGCLDWVNELDEATYRPPDMRDEGEPR